MPLEQLTYTSAEKQTSNDHNSTFALMVDNDMLKKYKKDKSIPLAQVVDSFDVFKFDDGSSGKLGRPTKLELTETFGTSNDDDVVKFMLENGNCHGKPALGNGFQPKPMAGR